MPDNWILNNGKAARSGPGNVNVYALPLRTYAKDEETVRSAGDGKRYQVQSGAQQYWMNGDGQYVPSNNPNYDPNRDPRFNHQTWKKADIEE